MLFLSVREDKSKKISTREWTGSGNELCVWENVGLAKSLRKCQLTRKEAKNSRNNKEKCDKKKQKGYQYAVGFALKIE